MLVINRIGSFQDGFLMTEQRPQLFGDMRCVGRHQDAERFEDSAFVALGILQLVDADHEGTDSRIEGESFVVFFYLLDSLMDTFPLRFGRFLVNDIKVAFAVEVKLPELADETGNAFYAVGVPRFGHFHRSQEHLIHTQRVRTVFLHQIIGILHVVFRLGHLLDFPAANILTVFKDKFGIFEIRHPVFERLNIEDIIMYYIDIHVDRRGFVLFAEVERHELISTNNAINEVGATLNHTLVDKFLEGFVFAADAEVKEEFVPEAGVDEVACAVFRTADVKIHVLPVRVGLLGDQRVIVLRIHIAQIVRAGARESGHGAVFARIAIVSPVLGACQRRLACFGGQELIYFGKHNRQFGLGDGIGHSVLVIDRERLTPVTLAAEDGIAQTVVHRTITHPHLLDLLNHRLASLFDRHAGDKSGIDTDTGFAVHGFLPRIGIADLIHSGSNHLTDRKVEVTCKGKVAAVVRGHSHDGTGTVIRQHVIAHPDGDALFGDRVDGECSCEHTAHLLDLCLTLALGAVFRPRDVSFHLGLLLRRGNLVNHLMLRTDHHERHTENGIGAGGENFESCLTLNAFNIAAHVYFLPIQLTFLGEREPDSGTFTAADPVTLDFFQRICPINLIQTLQQSFCVRGDTQDPLSHQLAFHRETAAHRESVHNFIVGEHGAKFRTPVHPCIGKIGQSIVHQNLLLFLFGSGLPLLSGELQRLGLRNLQTECTILSKGLHQFANGSCLIRLVAVVGVKQLDECPLRPFVIVGVAGLERAVPVE